MFGLLRRPAEEPASAPPSTSRRREALLRHRAEQAETQRVTAADVEALQRDRSPAVRALVAAKLGRQLDALTASSQRDLALTVLGLLTRDAAAEVRKALAETVAPSASLPSLLAARLAGDEIEVARPVLERSPALGDATLVELLRTRSPEHALAIAGRERLSEVVSAAVVATGHRPAAAKLAGNIGAVLSRPALERIIADHPADPEIEACLLRRPGLPYEIVDEMVGLIGDRIGWDLLRTRRMPPDQARVLVEALRERAAIGLGAREHGDRQFLQQLRERFEAGELTPDELLGRLKEGDLAGLEVGLALRAGLDPDQVRRLLYHQDRHHTAALCLKAAFATPYYVAMRMAVDLAEAAVDAAAEAPTYGAGTIHFLQMQYERLAQDEPRLHELLGR